jgi:hypothetical protein
LPAANKLGTLPPVKNLFIISDWFSVPLSHAKNNSLYGRYELSNPIPGATDTDVKLAYVRRNARESGATDDNFSYSQLPAIIHSTRGHLVSVAFELGTDLFEVFLQFAGIVPVVLDPEEFRDCRYRYIVLSRDDYNNMNIDWNDYPAVARTLGFTP